MLLPEAIPVVLFGKRKRRGTRQPTIMRVIVAILCASLVCAQTHQPAVYALGTTPKTKADDYEAHGKSGDIEIGAEYMVHSFSRGQAMYIARDFITVEVALYAPQDGTAKAKPLDINYGDFQLTVNGKKIALVPMDPYTVATTLDHPDWQPERPRIEASAGTPNGRVTLGAPPHTPLPNGDPPGYPRTTPLPQPDPPGGIELQPSASASQIAVECALPEGPQRAPISGFLYFVYSGNTKSVKSLVLHYHDAELKLR
jgi:hypothetical protein